MLILDSQLSLYQILALAVVLLIVLKNLIGYLLKQKSGRELLAWFFVSFTFSYLAIWPATISRAAVFLGFQNGAHALLTIFSVVLAYLIFRLLYIVENLERKITKLVRKISLEHPEEGEQ